MPVLAAAAHPCAACPGHPGYHVLRGFKSAAPFGRSSCAANRCAAAATQAGASCIRDAGSPELSHSRIPDVACGHLIYAPLDTQPGRTANRPLPNATLRMAHGRDHGWPQQPVRNALAGTLQRLCALDAGPICASLAAIAVAVVVVVVVAVPTRKPNRASQAGWEKGGPRVWAKRVVGRPHLAEKRRGPAGAAGRFASGRAFFLVTSSLHEQRRSNSPKPRSGGRNCFDLRS